MGGGYGSPLWISGYKPLRSHLLPNLAEELRGYPTVVIRVVSVQGADLGDGLINGIYRVPLVRVENQERIPHPVHVVISQIEGVELLNLRAGIGYVAVSRAVTTDPLKLGPLDGVEGLEESLGLTRDNAWGILFNVSFFVRDKTTGLTDDSHGS